MLYEKILHYCELKRGKSTNYILGHEDVWGSGCIDPHFLDLGTSWSRQLHAPAALLPYSLGRRLHGPQSRSGRHGEVKIIGPTGTRTPSHWSSSL
jgi:hypothetical protein